MTLFPTAFSSDGSEDSSGGHGLRLVRDILRLVRLPYFIKIIWILLYHPDIFEEQSDSEELPAPL